MHVRAYDDPSEFSRRVTPLLLEREAENCITLGILAQAARGDVSAPPPMMLAVEDDAGRPVVVATMNRAFVLLLTRAAPRAAEAVAHHLVDNGIDAPGVQAPLGTVEPFVDAWVGRTGWAAKPLFGLAVHQLDAVTAPSLAAPGSLRAATADDADLLDAWSDAFALEAHVERRPAAERRAHVEAGIGEGRYFVWCDPADGPAVCLVGTVGRTPNGIRIGSVYTPPERRRRGYASAAVAEVSRRMLAGGRRFCFLYTDLANPTSNKIYAAVGYRRVCDFRKYEFAPPATAP
jgi:hypothetical protein